MTEKPEPLLEAKIASLLGNLKEPKTITAEYVITTPMFIGDANQDATRISAASVKGALRFWWRALNWDRVRHDFENNEEALKALYQQEIKLFGGSADSGCVSSFSLQVKQHSFRRQLPPNVHRLLGNSDLSAARYLGYGVMEAFDRVKRNRQTREVEEEFKAGQLTRPCFDEKQSFSVKLCFNSNIDDDSIDAMKKVLKIWGLLGGLGSKARKGLGSIAIKSLEVSGLPKKLWKAPISEKEYIDTLSSLLNIEYESKELPPFTALSSFSRIEKLVEAETPYKVLNQYAEQMIHYRSWGKDGKVFGQPREGNFKDDHDWYRERGLVPSDFHPQRIIFGLPHSYHKQLENKVGRTLDSRDRRKQGRRASPLFFHVHPIGNQFIGIAMLLPAQFLPEGELVNAGGEFVPQKIEWSVLNEFLDGGDRHSAKQRFPKKVIILEGKKP